MAVVAQAWSRFVKLVHGTVELAQVQVQVSAELSAVVAETAFEVGAMTASEHVEQVVV